MPEQGDLYTEFLDLPPGPRPPNHYAILLISLFEPSPTVIHNAVLSQNAKLRRWALHPDRKTADRVQEMLNELGRADFILGDPKTKAEYDRKLAAQLGLPLPPPPIAVPPPIRPEGPSGQCLRDGLRRPGGAAHDGPSRRDGPRGSEGRTTSGPSDAPVAARCAACGARMWPGDLFCRACGAETPGARGAREAARRKSLLAAGVASGVFVLIALLVTLTGRSPSSPASPPQPPDRQARLAFDESAPPLAPQKEAQSFALRFSRDGQCVQIPNQAALNLTGPMTLEAWVKPEVSLMERGFHFILSKNMYDTGYCLLAVGQKGSARYCLNDTVWRDLAPTPGAWTHIAGTSTGAKAQLFINGELRGEEAPKLVGKPNDCSLWIGSSPFGGDANWRGAIGEVRLWALVRTPDEIKRDMRRKLTGKEPGLRAYWSFEEGSGQILHDLTGHIPPACTGSRPGPDNDDPEWVPGAELEEPIPAAAPVQPPAAGADASDRIWALLKVRKYAEARQLVAKLKGEPANKPAPVDEHAAEVLSLFWSKVVSGAKGRSIILHGIEMEIVDFRDDKLVLKYGTNQVTFPVADLRPSAIWKCSGCPDSETLMKGVLFLAEGDLDGAERCLAAVPDSPITDAYRARLDRLRKAGPPAPP